MCRVLAVIGCSWLRRVDGLEEDDGWEGRERGREEEGASMSTTGNDDERAPPVVLAAPRLSAVPTRRRGPVYPLTLAPHPQRSPRSAAAMADASEASPLPLSPSAGRAQVQQFSAGGGIPSSPKQPASPGGGAVPSSPGLERMHLAAAHGSPSGERRAERGRSGSC